MRTCMPLSFILLVLCLFLSYSDVDSLLAVPVHDDDKMRLVPESCALEEYKEEALSDTYNDLVNLPYVSLLLHLFIFCFV